MIPQEKFSTIEVDADVLILGAGSAGAMAVIGAAEQGCKNIVIVDKGRTDSCGCCGGGQDHYGAHLNSGPEWDSDEATTKWYSSPGWGVSTDLVEKTFTKVVGSMIKRLEDMGVEFFKESDGTYYRTQALGQPGPLWLMMKNGKYLKRMMAAKVNEHGVKAVEQVMVTNLLVENGKVVGALGFNRRNGDFYVFKAKSVVLAMGSHQSRWSTNSTGNPFNIWQNPCNTGTNVVIAYEVGAKVKNLELCVSTTLPKGYGAPAMCAFGGMGAYMVNVNEERFMKNYHPLGEQAPRGFQIRAEHRETIEGRDPLYIDARNISENDMLHLNNNLLSVDKDTFLEYLEQRGVDLRNDLLEVELGEYSGRGNLITDNNCESNIKGLFGLPFSGMLSTALCGGLVVGIEAAKKAMEDDNKDVNIDPKLINNEKDRIYTPLTKSEGYSPKEFEDLIRQVMNYYVGYVRNQVKLEIATKKLNLLEKHIGQIKADNLHELLRAHESIHLLKYCQLMLRAVIERKGMKGFYERSDVTAIDKKLLQKDVALWQEAGELMCAYEDR